LRDFATLLAAICKDSAMIAVVLEAFGFEKRDGGELAPVSFLAWDLRQRRSKFAAPAIVAAPKGSNL